MNLPGNPSPSWKIPASRLIPLWFTPYEKHYKETTRRHKPADLSREYTAKFYAGIGVDISAGQSWGDKVWQSEPEKITMAVRRSFDASGKGIVISRDYEETTLPSLKAIGQTTREIAKGQA